MTPPGRLALVAAAGLCAPPRRPRRPPRRSSSGRSRFTIRDALWGTRTFELRWVGTEADGAERVEVVIVLHPDQERFELTGRYRRSALEYRTSDRFLGADEIRSFSVSSGLPGR